MEAQKKKTIVIKYGGNAMTNPELSNQIVSEIVSLWNEGVRVVLVHGGGPFINKILRQLNIESEFVGGHRRTSDESIKYIEMALSGEVTPTLVRLFHQHGIKSVGLSGKDGGMITARKKYHIAGGNKVDIGRVGEVNKVDSSIVQTLLDNQFLPVISCMATDENGVAYNVNADMVAGHLAGAIEADKLFMLTDVDGLYEDFKKPETLISQININEIRGLMGTVISGGMIPKMEACSIAIENGTSEVCIINGTKSGLLIDTMKNNNNSGTTITN